MLKEKNMKDFIGQRKHWSHMSKNEIEGLFKRLKSVEANGLRWRISGHTLDRLKEKGIQATYKDLVSTIHNSTIIEYKIDEMKYQKGEPEERVVLRAKSIVNREYNLNVVYSLTNYKIITVWVNHINDFHETLDWNIYNPDMRVFGV